MNALKMCLNWKVMAGLTAVGAGIFVFAPNLATAALPFLVLAICPLSMIFMMGAMNNMGNGSQSSAARAMGGNRKPQSREEELTQLEAQQQGLASKIAQLEAEPDVRPKGRPGAAATQLS
jgi:uncharacterized protein YlxW (UPF0749 family)